MKGATVYNNYTLGYSGAPSRWSARPNVKVTGLSLGSHSLQAVFAGSEGTHASASAVLTHTVQKSATTTTLSCPATSRVGDSVNCQIEVSTESFLSLGNEQFQLMDGDTVLATGTLEALAKPPLRGSLRLLR
jgi:hypothetical protein